MGDANGIEYPFIAGRRDASRSTETFDSVNPATEALALANDVEYGLGAAIWTRDSWRLLRMAERVEAGTVWCNTAQVYNPALPFGGYKNSGLGNASGQGAIEGNTKLKGVSIRFDDNAPAPGWNL